MKKQKPEIRFGDLIVACYDKSATNQQAVQMVIKAFESGAVKFKNYRRAKFV